MCVKVASLDSAPNLKGQSGLGACPGSIPSVTIFYKVIFFNAFFPPNVKSLFWSLCRNMVYHKGKRKFKINYCIYSPPNLLYL